ncbi:hypothetical protein E2C01_042728 [Portunus trituberculatus]|uniref:Uncharacterized protein n=1 Tax=Portunus trituberculatus TaxID=210409 RepID=A0A5B7FND2_PORTR|nr:hypothetical protein [Portunus trituberculatus]
MEHLRRTRGYRPRCSHLFVSVTEPQRVVHPHTFSHWICQVIQRAHVDVSEEDTHLVRVKAHDVRAVATSAWFKKIRSIPAIFRVPYKQFYVLSSVGFGVTGPFS